MQIEPVQGPSATDKTVMVMVDATEAAIIRDALDVYAKAHVGPVADICAKLEAGFNWAIA